MTGQDRNDRRGRCPGALALARDVRDRVDYANLSAIAELSFDILAELIIPLNDMHVAISNGTRTAHGSTLERLSLRCLTLALCR